MSPKFGKAQVLFATAGAAVAVSLLAWASTRMSGLLLLGSFGASSLLLFALPEAPLSQPRSVVGGHVLASLIAAGCLAWCGPAWWAVGLATGLGVGAMMLTRTLHPPAASNAIIVFFAKPAWSVLLLSSLGGAVTLVAIAFAYHRATGRHRYPRYWRALPEAAG